MGSSGRLFGGLSLSSCLRCNIANFKSLSAKSIYLSDTYRPLHNVIGIKNITVDSPICQRVNPLDSLGMFVRRVNVWAFGSALKKKCAIGDFERNIARVYHIAEHQFAERKTCTVPQLLLQIFKVYL